MKKVSLICTLKNEEKTVNSLLDSILSQSRVPDEIIIVDGGSTDKTVDIIKSYMTKNNIIKLIIDNGSNIAEGRNIAIQNSLYDLIASTDSGCRLTSSWLENLILPFEKSDTVDVVCGWYEPVIETEFDRCVAELTFPKLETVLKAPDNFLPSSRSVAFKKDCWNRVGGYPEWLYTAEDTLFDLNLKEAGCKFVFSKNAVVYWHGRKNFKSIFKQYYLYAKGSGEAGIFVKNYIITAYFPFFSLVILFIFGFYQHLYWVAFSLSTFVFSYLVLLLKRIKYGSFNRFLLFTCLLITQQISRVIGYFVGVLNRLLIRFF